MARKEKVYVVVDDATTSSGDPWAVLHPVWWTANIYDGPALYEHSFQAFSLAQRCVFAVLWYRSEVNNGGHKQFFFNSTGIVWPDALAGLESIGIPKAAHILRLSADRFGGSPPLEHDERQELLAHLKPAFDDCDDAFYKLQKKVDFDAKIMEYIQSQPQDFYFSGTIERVVLPRRPPTVN